MPDLKIDWEQIVKDAAESGEAALDGVLTGAKEDLKKYAADMAKDAIAAAREGRGDLLAMLKNQARTLGEIQRIGLNTAGWDLVGNVFSQIAKVAVKAALAVSIV